VTPVAAMTTVCKVIVIYQAHKLTHLAQQAIRAMLEQYSKSCRIVFVADHLHSLSAAVRSRCLEVAVPACSQQDVTKTLGDIVRHEAVAIRPAQLAELARAHQGNLFASVTALQYFHHRRGTKKGTTTTTTTATTATNKGERRATLQPASFPTCLPLGLELAVERVFEIVVATHDSVALHPGHGYDAGLKRRGGEWTLPATATTRSILESHIGVCQGLRDLLSTCIMSLAPMDKLIHHLFARLVSLAPFVTNGKRAWQLVQVVARYDASIQATRETFSANGNTASEEALLSHVLACVLQISLLYHAKEKAEVEEVGHKESVVLSLLVGHANNSTRRGKNMTRTIQIIQNVADK